MSKINTDSNWQPSCSMALLKLRADMLTKIRAFFDRLGVLEVETPLLGHGVGTDPELDYFVSQYQDAGKNTTMFLQTSPEFAMKRLLAAGSGSIYQICKAFRNGESGRFHNPEFTILEWYREGFNLQQLTDEATSLLKYLLADVLDDDRIVKFSYGELFEQYVGIDPMQATPADFSVCARRLGLFEAEQLCGEDDSCWLDFLFSHCLQPALSDYGICTVSGYPASQAGLARLQTGNSRVAERVEIFVHGVELANGYFELTDDNEQAERFERDRLIRTAQGKSAPASDRRFLAALTQGLPDCSGIALGLDRVLMLMAGVDHIDEVLSFPWQRA